MKAWVCKICVKFGKASGNQDSAKSCFSCLSKRNQKMNLHVLAKKLVCLVARPNSDAHVNRTCLTFSTEREFNARTN